MDIDNLLSKMSLEEKLCQMTQINGRCVFKNDKEGVHDFIALGLTDEQYDRIGSVLAYTVDFGAKKMQDEHLKNDPNKIPLVIMLDVIHGWRTAFPIPLAIGATFNTDIAKECCKIAAQEATADGVMVAFSPMVDLARDARWGRIMETTSEDAYLNGEFGKAMIRGYHEGGLAVCVKHYAAYGGAEAGRDYNSVDMSEHTLREYYLRAYRECLEENPELFMTSFNSLNGIPSSANKHLMLDILRDEWGYNGVVISDYAAVNELISHKCKPDGAEAAKAAINCTVDIEMCTAHYIKQGEKLVKEGRLSEETLNASVRRILKLKEKLGLFDNPYYKLKGERAAVTAESRAAALRAASESIVLLKNDGVLPLKKQDDIALIGPFADEKEIIGSWSFSCDKTATVTLKQGIETLLGRAVATDNACGNRFNSTDESGFAAALEKAKNADIVVMAIGEHQSEAGECKSKTDIRIPAVQRKLFDEVMKLGKKVVTVVFGGRPLVLGEAAKSNALLYAWQPGTEGGNAVAQILYGIENPSGKLPVSLPRSVGQCPIHYDAYSTGRPAPVDAGIVIGTSCYLDELNSPLYPFGYGLSYTDFEITPPVLSSDKMSEGGSITASVKVKNSGERGGAEVVQLYISDDFSEIVRPVKQLKGFKKVYLGAGEEKEVAFLITEKTLSYFGAEDREVVEKGTFKVFIGKDSGATAYAQFEFI